MIGYVLPWVTTYATGEKSSYSGFGISNYPYHRYSVFGLGIISCIFLLFFCKPAYFETILKNKGTYLINYKRHFALISLIVTIIALGIISWLFNLIQENLYGDENFRVGFYIVLFVLIIQLISSIVLIINQRSRV